jgi:hypothetical protein
MLPGMSLHEDHHAVKLTRRSFLKLFHSTPADLVLAYASAVRFAPDPSGKGKGKAVARPQSRLEVVRALSTLPTARLALAAGAEPAWHAVACGRERGLLVSVAGTLARGKGSAEACGSFVHRFVLKRPEWTEEDADKYVPICGACGALTRVLQRGLVMAARGGFTPANLFGGRLITM